MNSKNKSSNSNSGKVVKKGPSPKINFNERANSRKVKSTTSSIIKNATPPKPKSK